jgi:membrane protease YdiL (CAAX protease family)
MTADLRPDDGVDASEISTHELSDVPAAKPKPRIWTVFMAYIVALIGAVLVQVIAVIALVARIFAHGGDVKQISTDLPKMVSAPAGFVAFAAMSQFVMVLAAFIPARLSAQPVRQRLGLIAPDLPMWGYLIIAIGSVVPLAAGVGLAYALAQVINPDESVRMLYEQMTWAWFVPFVLFIALVPGFVEETFFRGYIQRRLLQRWSPGAAILVTTILFALMHIMPHAIALAFVLGLWLGVLAWRTGSVWPGAVSHAFVNGSWNIWQVGKMLGIFPETTHIAVTATIAAVAVICFLASIWLVAHRRSQTDSPTIEAPQPSEVFEV